jgi:bidirectional [NiFe] hydrogenase diaphorase subunit
VKTASLTIDGQEIQAPPGEKLLFAALDNGIFIPHLCACRDSSTPDAACRMCWVEIEGKPRPVTACTETVAPGMVVNTRGEAALRLARSGMELLLASHELDCAHCAKSGACQLQKMAGKLKVNLRKRRFRKIPRNLPVDASSPLFSYDPNKCVLCGQCIKACRRQSPDSALGFAHRGFLRRVTTFADLPMIDATCQNCGDCVEVCPTGALALSNGKAPTASPRGSGAKRQ